MTTNLRDGRDLGFAAFAQIPWQGSEVILYRTNGGATTDFGVVIRQERTLLPGVKVVRNLADFYHCCALSATPTGSGVAITDEGAECKALGVSRRDYALKPHVYF